MSYLLFIFVVSTSFTPPPPIKIQEYACGAYPCGKNRLEELRAACAKDGVAITTEWDKAYRDRAHLFACHLTHPVP